MPKISFAKQVRGWELLAASAEIHAAELPENTALRGELTAAAEDAKASHSEYLQLRGQMLKAAERMRDAVMRGEEAERRLRRILQAHHGAANPVLIRYGIKPRRERRRGTGEPEDGSAVPLSPEEPAGGE